ncbi:MAG: 30S ribosomal protein S6 [Elusimicrobiota bacterium]
MNRYESIFICNPQLAAEQVNDQLEKIKAVIKRGNGEIISVDNWGKRQLAYPLKGYREGCYIYLQLNLPPQLVSELNNYYLVSENILRHLTIRINEKHLKYIIPHPDAVLTLIKEKDKESELGDKSVEAKAEETKKEEEGDGAKAVAVE